MGAMPFATTTVAVTRPNKDAGTRDPYDPVPVPTGTAPIVAHVRGVISLPSMSTNLSGGDRIVWNATLASDVCTLQPEDVVTDVDGTKWTVLNVKEFHGIGPAHMVANLRRVTGAT
jgi:hypothetical protein